MKGLCQICKQILDILGNMGYCYYIIKSWTSFRPATVYPDDALFFVAFSIDF